MKAVNNFMAVAAPSTRRAWQNAIRGLALNPQIEHMLLWSSGDEMEGLTPWACIAEQWTKMPEGDFDVPGLVTLVKEWYALAEGCQVDHPLFAQEYSLAWEAATRHLWWLMENEEEVSPVEISEQELAWSAWVRAKIQGTEQQDESLQTASSAPG